MIDKGYWADDGGPSADDAIATARDEWTRAARDMEAAGKEIPVVDVPASMGDLARTSVEATTELARRARGRTWGISFDLAAMERAWQEQQAAINAPAAHSEPQQAAPTRPQATTPRKRTRAPTARTTRHTPKATDKPEQQPAAPGPHSTVSIRRDRASTDGPTGGKVVL